MRLLHEELMASVRQGFVTWLTPIKPTSEVV